MAFIPVLIIGAGPTGLMMAALLKRHRIAFRIIDKQQKPVQTSNALGVQTRTLEVWDDLGILSVALKEGNPLYAFNIYQGEKKLTHIDFNNLNGVHPFILALPQHNTEQLLIHYLKKEKIPVEMQVELIKIKQKKDELSITLRNKKGKKEIVTTDWLIGCDGAHSAVRTKSNIAFTGKELPQHFVIADCKVKTDLAADEGHLFLAKEGVLAILRFDKNHFRIIADVTGDPNLCSATSLTHAQLKELVAKRCPFKIEVKKPIWTSGFWIQERIAGAYRLNNIFLAGDAAHVHSPAGGQGMNTGIQDVYNLAWKLALVIQGRAKQDILDTYYEERYPIAKSVLHQTTLLTKFITSHNSIVAILRNFLFSFVIKNQKVKKKIAFTLTEIGIHYNEGKLIMDCLSFHSGPPAGTRMIDAFYNTKHTLMETVRGPQSVLLFFLGKQNNLNDCLRFKNIVKTDYPFLRFVLINTNKDCGSWDELKILDKQAKLHKLYGVTTTPTLYFIRPDKYIGFRGELDDSNKFLNYLQNIFG